MNYKQYREVMDAEGLEESELVKLILGEAIKKQKYIKSLKAHEAPESAVVKLEKEKGELIWLAIFTAQDEKQQGWRYIEDGESVRPMLEQQLEDIKRAKRAKSGEGIAI